MIITRKENDMTKQNAVQAAIANIHDLADIILDRQYSTEEYRALADFLYMNKRSEYGEIFYNSPELVDVLGELVNPPKKTKATPVVETTESE